jgi:hypothetical protein
MGFKQTDGAGREDATAKRSYRRPEVRRLGSVRELTLAGGSVAITDSGIPPKPNKVSP